MKSHQLDYWSCLRLAIALVWIYQGIWMKIVAVDERHLAIVDAAMPFGTARFWLGAIGLGECSLGLWFICGWRRRFCAWVQVALLMTMNLGGILFARNEIPDPAGMVLMNLVFALSILGAGGVWRIRNE